MRIPTDTELLDWMAAQSTGEAVRWIARPSSGGRGFRTYATTNPMGFKTPREALLVAWAADPLRALDPAEGE